MTVGSDVVNVEKIGHSQLANAEFKPLLRQRSSQREEITISFDRFCGQRNDLMQHHARDIRRCAEIRIAHHVQICETAKTKGVADSASAGLFHVQ